MHERSPKNKPLDVILYEIDMLRHCAKTLPSKMALARKTGADADRAEYYLGIEGFLLHLRNLIGFFVREPRKTDLSIRRPKQWAERPVEVRECADFVERVQQINIAHGMGRRDCYSQISKFLQHCTAHRHAEARSWAIEKIFADIEPVLNEFVNRFAAHAEIVTVVLGTVDNTTASFRTFNEVPQVIDGEPKCGK